MKTARFLSAFFALLAVVLIAATGIGYVRFHDAPPMILTPVEEVENRTEALMEAFCRGDYAAARESLYGRPELRWDPDAASELGTVLWEAFGSAVAYEFSGECYASGSGIFRDVVITVLDVPAMIPQIQEHFQFLLEQYTAGARRNAEALDEEGNIREEFMKKVLCEAAQQAVRENSIYAKRQITLALLYQDGQWWVVPDQELIALVTGVMTQ